MTVVRRIHVYRTRYLKDDDGTLVDTAAVPIFNHVKSLRPRRQDPSRYMRLSDGNQLIMEVVDLPAGATVGSVRGRFGIKRMIGLPRIELDGTYSDLQLAVGAGLAELRHFVVYPNRQLVAFELNGNAPGPGRWASYLMYKCPTVHLVTTDMVLAGTTAETLRRLGRVAGASITVYSERVDALGQLDAHLRQGLRALKRSSDNAREITFGFELGSRKRSESLDLTWKNRIAAFLGSNNGRQALEDFTVRAFDQAAGRTRTVDLLEDTFVGYKQVVTLDAGGRVIDSDSMFSAIDEVVGGIPDQV